MGRLILPVFEKGRLVYYTGRTLIGQGKKYYNPTNVVKGKSEFLFNLDVAEKYKNVVVDEGFFDSVRVGDNSVALLGNSISDVQLEKLLLAGFEKICVCLDAEARKEGIQLALKLQQHFETWIVFLPKNDPDVALREAQGNTRLYVRKARHEHLFHPYLDFLLQVPSDSMLIS